MLHCIFYYAPPAFELRAEVLAQCLVLLCACALATQSEERAQKAGLWSSHLVKCPITRDQLEHFQCYFTPPNAILTVAKKYCTSRIIGNFGNKRA